MTKRQQKYFRQVEVMLYDYKYLDQAIATLEAELEAIMPQTSTSLVKVGQGSSKTPFDTSSTEQWGIKRAESQLRVKLLEKRRHKAAIKGAREQLTDEENTFVWLRYDHEKQHREIWEALHMEERSYFRFRRKVIKKIAKGLGFL